MNLIPLTIQVDTAGADKAISDMDRVSASAKNMATSAKQIKTDMTSAFGPSLTNNDVFGPIIPGATAASAAVKKYGSDMITANTATKDFRDTLRVARPVLNELGASMGLIGPLAGAARAGITGLGAAIVGTLIVALENAADAATIMETRLNAIGGGSGGAMLRNLTNAANDARVPLSSLAGAFETLTVAQLKNERASGVVYGSFADGSKKIADALTTIALAAKQGGAISSEVKTIADTFASSMAKNKGLTAGLFDELVQKAPTVAAAIAKAFGSSSIADFAIKLGDTTIPMSKVISQLAAYKEAQEALTANTPTTLAQAWDNLTTAIGKAVTALSTKLGVSSWVESLAKWIDDAVANGTKLTFWLDSVSTAFQKLASINFQGPIGAFISMVAGLNSVVTAAQSAYEWLSKLGSVQPTGGGYAPPSTPPLSGGGSAYSNPYAGPSGNYSGYVDQYGMTNDTAAQGGVTGAYASGGAFQVRGTGGTDSQRVSFMATPGEQVSVTPPPGSHQVSASGYAGGGDFTVPKTTAASGQEYGGNVDSTLTSSSQALIDSVRKMSDEMSGLGMTEEGVKSVISGAGNDHVPDVIRLGNIQTTAAITQSADRIIQTILTGDINLTAAVNNLASTQAAAAAASSAAASSSGSSGSSSSGSSTATQTGLSGLAKGGKDTTMGNGGQMALWNSLYGDLYKGSASGGSPTAGSNPQTPSTTMVGASAYAGAGKNSSSTYQYPQNDFAYTGGAVYDLPADVPMADGGEIDVPKGYEADTFRMGVRAKTGETVKVSKKGYGDGGGNSSGSGGRPIEINFNVTAKDADSFDNSKAQIMNTLRTGLSDALRHV